jgi:hypothetical protein
MMLSEYVQKALKKAQYKVLDNEYGLPRYSALKRFGQMPKQ